MNDPRLDNAAATFDFSIDDNSSILGGSVGDDSFLNSLESGGALLSMAGHWSTADGSMQWTGGKEELFDPWSTAGPGAAADTRGCTPASAGASEPIKPDPGGAWLSSALIGDLETKTSSTVTNSQSLPAPAASAEAPNNDGGNLRPFPNRYARDGVSMKDEVIDTKWQQQQQQQQCQQPPGHQLPPTTAPAPTTTAEAVAALPNRTTRRQSSLIARGRTPAAPVAAATSAGARFPGGAGVSTVEAPTAPPPTGEGADDDDDDDDEGDEMGEGSAGMDSELSEKRRRNREHAKRSRMRKRVRLGGLEDMVLELRRENIRLRQIVKQGIPDLAEDILRKCAKDNINADLVDKEDVVQGMRPAMTIAGSSSHSGGGGSAGSRARPKLEGGSSSSGSGSGRRHKDRRVPSALKLMSPSYQSVRALSESQANFILTNPNLPGCPIIYASPGFLELTGYEASQVMGKNCRFLQGPGTDPVAVSIIRNNLKYGRDTSVCILNYKADGKPFWNQLSIGNLLDAHGKVANHVGVLCEVKQMPPADFRRLLHRVPLPESLLHDSSDSGEDAGKYNDNNSNNASSVSRSNQGAPTPRSTTNVDDSNRSGGNDNKRRAGLPRVVDRLRRTRAAAASSSEQ